ncbi:hypothetical protein K435DRAFT_305167 [Dendrothele bispora CBS 962.96]|uniref:Wings apart-like protein C-terminal domain-containing protein n=1 Tax=Dendrothele bispora (strain CBS 962.96) TaxID=1314807 RepID=A0A4V4HDW5_DENBC|nr:hypothetical protein K435DRAFT_305167 [Dendrothele bispora CBS 962.96]
MLGRSKTESSLETSPSSASRTLFDKTLSLPSLPSPSRPKSPPLPLPSPPVVQDPKPAPLTRTTSNKRTYAGKSRTFLVSVPISGNSLSSLEQTIQNEEDDFLNHESYSSLRSRWGVDNSEDDPFYDSHAVTMMGLSPPKSKSNVDSPSTTPSSRGKGRGRLKSRGTAEVRAPPPPVDVVRPLRSITELRDKGESRRFLDQVGYLLEGMGPEETPALRKASALEIVNQLCDIEFARKAKAADFLSRAWEVFMEAGAGKNEDKVLDILLVFFSALVSRDLTSLTDLATRSTTAPSTSSKASTPSSSPFVATLFSLLDTLSPSADPLYILSSPHSSKAEVDAQLKKLGIMKADRASLRSIHNAIISSSGLFPPDTSLSSILLITHTLSTLPSALLSPSHIPALLESLKCLTDRLPRYFDESGPSSSGRSGSTSKATDNSGGSGKSSNGKTKSKTTGETSNSNLGADADSDLYLSLSQRIQIQPVLYLLIILDSYLLGQWASTASTSAVGKYGREAEKALAKARETWLAQTLVRVGIWCEEIVGSSLSVDGDDSDNSRNGIGVEELRDEDDDDELEPESGSSLTSTSTTASDCLDMTLRVLVSLTHAHADVDVDPRLDDDENGYEGRSRGRGRTWTEKLVRNPAAVLWIVRMVVGSDGERWKGRDREDKGKAREGSKYDGKGKGKQKDTGKEKERSKAEGGKIKIKKEKSTSSLFGGSDEEEDEEEGESVKEEGLCEEDNGDDGDDHDEMEEQARQTRAMDRLCLALGLLTNLVKAADDAKDVLREMNYDPSCTNTFKHEYQSELQSKSKSESRPEAYKANSPACINACKCRNATSILRVLVGVYRNQLTPPSRSSSSLKSKSKSKSNSNGKRIGKNGVKHEPSPSPPLPPSQHEKQTTLSSSRITTDALVESDSSFLLGHLSVLFGLLMYGSRENQEIVLDALPWGDGGHGHGLGLKEEDEEKPLPSSLRRGEKEKLNALVENAKTLGVYLAAINRSGRRSGRGSGGGGRDADTDTENESEDEDELALGVSREEMPKSLDVAKEVIRFLVELRDRGVEAG